MDPQALTKATLLLNMAGNAAASTEEARTAALLAAKLIKQHGFVLVMKAATTAKPAAPAYKPPAPSKPVPPQATPSSKYRVVVSKIYSFCKKCKKTIKAGDKVSVAVNHVHDLENARHAACA